MDRLSSAPRVHGLAARGTSGPGSKPHLSLGLSARSHFTRAEHRADHDWAFGVDREGCIELTAVARAGELVAAISGLAREMPDLWIHAERDCS